MNAAQRLLLLSGRSASLASRAAAIVSAAGGVLFNPSDLSTMTVGRDGTGGAPSSGSVVGRIYDKAGSGRYAAAPSDAARPLLTVSGGLAYISYDGVDDRLAATFTIAQPFVRVSAFRPAQVASGSQIIGGGTENAGVLWQGASGNNLSIFSGSGVGIGAGSLAANTDYIATERHNGASSRIAVGTGSYTTGNAGTTVPGGMTLGALYSGAAYFSGRIGAVAMAQADLSDADITTLRQWVAAASGWAL